MDSTSAAPLRWSVPALSSGTASRSPGAANDTSEDLGDKPTEGIVALDEPIVKRGCIRDDLEYYLVNGIVVDLGNTLPDKERAML